MAPKNDVSEEKSKKISVSAKYDLISLIGAGALSGIPADIIAFPFCRIKTMMMTQGADKSAYQLTSARTAIRFIYNTQGIGGFYRGLSPVIISTIPGSTLFFTGMEFSQNLLGHNAAGIAFSGFGGQIAGSAVWVPSEIFKELRQMTLIKPELRDKTVFHLMKYVYRTEGFRGFYRGFLAQLLTFGPFNSIGISISKLLHDKISQDHSGIITSFGLNGFSFGASAILTTPFDVVKTRLQVVAADPKRFPTHSIFKCVETIFKKEGPPAFFAGAGYRGAWLGCRQGIAFTVFGKSRKIVNDYLNSNENRPQL
ncbi:MAG: hypothetical protein JSR33_07465 [Proteobacteria bacterium]|nr:hypothetical protein [Pseudomonadota bacterium]